MPTSIIVGYGDQEGYDSTDAAVRDDAHARDDQLRARGARMGVAEVLVQVRNYDEAVALAPRTPCAVAHGVVEVWPLSDTPEAADGA